MKSIIIFLIKAYKLLISPATHFLTGDACRFTPTCSQYTIEALERYGVIKGGLISLKRITRCNPWGGSGFDPLPKKYL